MKNKIANQFFINYIIVFLLSLLAAFFATAMLSFADSVISQTLIKNNYPAESLMQDDYTQIDAAPVVENGGGVQVVNKQYTVVLSEGLDLLGKRQLSTAEFTDFLMQSESKGLPYHIDVLYNEQSDFWLIVTFPTSIRLDIAVAYNKEAASHDMPNVAGALVAVGIFYLLLLALFTAIFSKITSMRITNPLKKFSEKTKRLREGDYSARVDLNLKNEFAELQDTFNSMAERIERETALRRQSEEERKRMILDISHDLKNPLASVEGYAELCLKKEISPDALKGYLTVIHNNSRRASRLLTELFELSRLESPAFHLQTIKTEACEYLRQVCGELLPTLEQAGFGYDFEIPDEEIYTLIDAGQIDRVFHNLMENAVRYNPPGTLISVNLSTISDQIVINFQDNGVGIPRNASKDIFKPFVRTDDSRNSETGGTGLGLAIAQKIIQAHGGKLTLSTASGKGCAFRITLPKI